MALMVWLKSGEEIMINGAMIQNPTAESIKIQLNNRVQMLRQRDCLELSDDHTPAERIYYEAMRLSGGASDSSMSALQQSVAAYRAACAASIDGKTDPDTVLGDIVALAADGEFYLAMVEARSLLALENPAHPVLPARAAL